MLILANVQINSGKKHDMLQFYIFHKISKENENIYFLWMWEWIYDIHIIKTLVMGRDKHNGYL